MEHDRTALTGLRGRRLRWPLNGSPLRGGSAFAAWRCEDSDKFVALPAADCRVGEVIIDIVTGAAHRAIEREHVAGFLFGSDGEVGGGTLNGAEALGRLTPEIQDKVTEQVRTALSRVFKEKMPDAGVEV
jgi:hypothetical protein